MEEEPEPSAKSAQHQGGVTNLRTFWTMEGQPCLVPAWSISSTVFVVENFMDYELNKATDYVIEIKAFEEWFDSQCAVYYCQFRNPCQ